MRRSPLAPVVLSLVLAGLVFGPSSFVPSSFVPPGTWRQQQEQRSSSSQGSWGLQRADAGHPSSLQARAAALGALDSQDIATTAKTSSAPRAISMVASPTEAYFTMVEKGVYNARMSPLKILHQSMMGGAYIGFGALLSLSIAGNMAGDIAGNPGLGKFIFAALFPVNLLLVLLTGAQLFTGNTATVPAAIFEGRASVGELVKSWGVSMVGNIIACCIFACATKYGGFLIDGTKELAIATCLRKTSASFGHTVVKAIGANWLVCMAVFLSGQARGMGGKMVGIWFPISTFVAIGMEHSVANMFLLPLGILAGAPVSIAQMVLRNWVPVCLGNAIAGVVFVAASYSFAYGRLGGN